MLHRMINRGERVVVNLKMSAQTLRDAPSRNVVAEIRGSEKPDEVVVLGGHIDSWDVGQGAMESDNGVFNVTGMVTAFVVADMPGCLPRSSVRTSTR